jgi:type IV fimbrial biogenesis protein FimT
MRTRLSSGEPVAPARGFTIIEMMIAIAVLGVLTSVGVPSLSAFLKNSALRGTAYELMSSMTLARSEAVKRGSRVVVCRSADPTAATPSCGGDTQDWSSGWLVFVAEDGNDDFDVGTDILLGIGNAVPNGVTVHSNTSADANVIYRTDGSTSAASTAHFALCDERGEGYGKQVNVTRVGRPDLTSGSTDTPIDSCSPSA